MGNSGSATSVGEKNVGKWGVKKGGVVIISLPRVHQSEATRPTKGYSASLSHLLKGKPIIPFYKISVIECLILESVDFDLPLPPITTIFQGECLGYITSTQLGKGAGYE